MNGVGQIVMNGVVYMNTYEQSGMDMNRRRYIDRYDEWEIDRYEYSQFDRYEQMAIYRQI